MKTLLTPIFKSLNTIILSVVLLAFCASGWAQTEPPAIDPQTHEICNQVIKNIYFDILKAKDSYGSLKNFDEKVMYQSQRGIFAILYQYDGEPQVGEVAHKPYRLGLTFETLGEHVFPTGDDTFLEEYPVLGVRLNGYQNHHLLKTEFDVLPLVKKYGRALADYQQEKIPLRLFLRPVKDTYFVREDIEFEVILKNVSKRNMIVKDLGANTLFFLFNDKFWGTRPSADKKGGKDVVLMAGDSLIMKFKGESFQEPKRIQIYGVYRMSVSGVNPYGTLGIDIVNK